MRNEQRLRLRELQVAARATRVQLAKSLHAKPSDKPKTSKRHPRPKKRKQSDIEDDTEANYKKVCLFLEISNLVAGLPLADLEEAKRAFEAKLQKPTGA